MNSKMTIGGLALSLLATTQLFASPQGIVWMTREFTTDAASVQFTTLDRDDAGKLVVGQPLMIDELAHPRDPDERAVAISDDSHVILYLAFRKQEYDEASQMMRDLTAKAEADRAARPTSLPEEHLPKPLYAAILSPDLKTVELRQQLPARGLMREFSISPDGHTAAWESAGRVEVARLMKGDQQQDRFSAARSVHPDPIVGGCEGFKFSQDGKYLLYLVANRQIRQSQLFWLATGEEKPAQRVTLPKFDYVTRFKISSISPTAFIQTVNGSLEPVFYRLRIGSDPSPLGLAFDEFHRLDSLDITDDQRFFTFTTLDISGSSSMLNVASMSAEGELNIKLARRLTELRSLGRNSASIDPTGTRLAYVDVVGAEDHNPPMGLFVFDAASESTGEDAPLPRVDTGSKPDETIGKVTFSPSGKYIVYTTKSEGTRVNRLWIVPSDLSAPPRNVDFGATSVVPENPFRFTRDGNTVVVQIAPKGSEGLQGDIAAIDLTSEGPPELIGPPTKPNQKVLDARIAGGPQ